VNVWISIPDLANLTLMLKTIVNIYDSLLVLVRLSELSLYKTHCIFKCSFYMACNFCISQLQLILIPWNVLREVGLNWLGTFGNAVAASVISTELGSCCKLASNCHLRMLYAGELEERFPHVTASHILLHLSLPGALQCPVVRDVSLPEFIT
jgi:hypothetical protein